MTQLVSGKNQGLMQQPRKSSKRSAGSAVAAAGSSRQAKQTRYAADLPISKDADRDDQVRFKCIIESSTNIKMTNQNFDKLKVHQLEK